MGYLTLMADYTTSALRDDFTGLVDPEEIGLGRDLAEAIRGWNERYRAVIPLGERERAAADVVSLIASLDEEGLTLVERVVAAFEDGSKVRYFSEGLLRHLP